MTPEERLSYEAGRRAVANPQMMAALRKKLGEIRWAQLQKQHRSICHPN